jgi:hypothetical protein
MVSNREDEEEEVGATGGNRPEVEDGAVAGGGFWRDVVDIMAEAEEPGDSWTRANLK